jgi:hypothetical protein
LSLPALIVSCRQDAGIRAMQQGGRHLPRREYFVMAGLVPAIHAFFSCFGAGKNVDARDKPGHDDRKMTLA